MIDIVFPKNNEAEFIKIAGKIGTKKLCFAYPMNEFNKVEKNPGFFYAVIAKPDELRKIKHADLVIVKSSPENRKVLESKRVDILFELEDNPAKDFMHHRNSGLNQVLCAIAHKNKTIIAFSFNSILNSREPAKVLGRMMQNAMLCRKFKVEMAVASFATTPYELRSLNDLKAFGAVAELSRASTALHDKILKNKKKQLPGYISEGVEQLVNH